MSKQVDLYTKIKGILEFEAGAKTKSQIAVEAGVTRQAVLYWIRGKESLISKAQSYSTVAFEHMISNLDTSTVEVSSQQEQIIMPEGLPPDDSDRSLIKSVRDENVFLKNKVLYLEKLMEVVGINAEHISKKKDIKPLNCQSKRELGQS
jgi:predicted transcriptional regulator